MPHLLRQIPADEPTAVLDALREALDGGPALLPVQTGRPAFPAPAPESIESSTALVIETSGSTGTGKRVTLGPGALRAGAAAADAALGGPGGWLLALPVHYIAGINVLTRSIVAGTVPEILPAGHFDAGVFRAAADRLAGAGYARRYTSLVPVQLARILDDPVASAALSTFDAVLVGGQSTPASLCERAADAGVRVVTTYGASETSGGCVYDGVPLDGIVPRVVDGELWLSGPVLAEGYLGDPERTAATFVEERGVRWYRTNDAAEIDANGSIQVSGRLDDVIISGGEKVQLGAVERVVRELDGQHAAVVTRRPDSQWGDVPIVVTAVAVPLRTVRDAVAARMGRAARPADVVVVESMPLLASGKPDRRAIRTLAESLHRSEKRADSIDGRGTKNETGCSAAHEETLGSPRRRSGNDGTSARDSP